MGELAVMLLDRAVGRWVEQPVERLPLNGYVREALDGLTAALAR
jgi:hypothetical protein